MRPSLCESPFPKTRDGCCADGRRCDEICIAVAAAEACKHAGHATTSEISCCEDNYETEAQSAFQEETGEETGGGYEGQQHEKCRKACRGLDEAATTDIDNWCSIEAKKSLKNEAVSDMHYQGGCIFTNDGGEPGVSGREHCTGKKLPNASEQRTECTHISADDQEITVCKSARFERSGSLNATHSKVNDANVEVENTCCKTTKRNCTKEVEVQKSCCLTKLSGMPKRSSESCCQVESDIETGSNHTNYLQTSATRKEDCHTGKEKRSSCCSKQSCAPTSRKEGSFNETEITDFREACSSHFEEAMRKYTAYLEAGMCICRNVLRSASTCCDKRKRAAVARKRKAVFGTPKSCCTQDVAPTKRCKPDDTAETEKRFCTYVEGPFYQNEETNCAPGPDYCKNIKNNYALTNFGANFDQSYDGKGTCCNSQVLKPMKALGSSEISHERCSLDYQKPTAKITVSKKNAHVDAVDDVEVNAAREHVTFSITGMTCTGCAKKVMGVLDHIVGVSNAKINFVAAIGDLDINKARISASAALQQLERETGFKCSRIAGYHQSLDLVMTRTAVQALSDNPPKGVESIERAGRVYRVVFDPLLIGARKVLSASGGILAPPSNDGAVTKGRRRLITKLWSFIAAAIFTVPVVVLAWSEAPVTFMAKSIVSLVLGTLVQVIAIPEFYIPALKALVFSRSIEMDMLVVISITAAYGYSVVAFSLEHAGINLQQGDFFETSTLLITLVLLGRLVSAYATVRAVQAVSLRSLQAETAYLESPADEVMKLDARLLEFNDVIRILPHSKIVSDGEVVNGVSAVDESMLTGEGHPIFKTVGDNVIAGTLNGPGPLSIRLTRLPGQNSITDIADLVQNALSTKPRIQDLADVVAGYFIPVVVTISVVVFAVWVVVALQIRDQNAGGAIGAAITYTIAVLAISCPCALGLAVPLVLVIAGGVAARAGVIIKHADATERGYRVTDVVFDKTGTLTNGQLQVVRQELHKSSFSSSEALALAFTLVKDNEHPISQAVANALKLQNAQMVELKAVESIPGAGIQAVWQGFSVKAGNAYWLRTDTNPTIVSLQADGLTLLCVTVKDELIISFGLKAELRSEAQSVINVLQARSIVCHVVSGDQPVVVSNIAASLNIPTSNIASRQSPANKQAYVQNLISMGKTTLFVGDGTNDAVAIAQANVGVQIGSASDITKATADVVLLGGLDGIITLLDVSKQSYYRIRFNFIWSFLYNLFAILLASGAFVKVRITPSFAGLGEIVSVLPVVLTALTLLRVKVGQR